MVSNLPNLLTVLRLALVPPLAFALLSQHAAIAVGLFALAALTEAADGQVARRFKQVTVIGTILDPIADKALLVSVYLCLAATGAAPLWLVVLVIGRDGLILGGIGLLRLLERPATIRPLLIGKVNTALEISYALAVMLELAGVPVHAALLSAAASLVGISVMASSVSYLVEAVAGLRRFKAR